MLDHGIPTPAYAGLGPEATPAHHLIAMHGWATRLAGLGYVLRTGGSDGAQSAFEVGAIAAGGEVAAMLPWDGYNDHLYGIGVDRFANYGRAHTICQAHTIGWERIARDTRAKMAAAAFHVLGRDLRTPVHFVLCWAMSPRYSQDGRIIDAVGDVGLAIRIAAAHGIPVHHLDYHLSMGALERFLLDTGSPDSSGDAWRANTAR